MSTRRPHQHRSQPITSSGNQTKVGGIRNYLKRVGSKFTRKIKNTPRVIRNMFGNNVNMNSIKLSQTPTPTQSAQSAQISIPNQENIDKIADAYKRIKEETEKTAKLENLEANINK